MPHIKDQFLIAPDVIFLNHGSFGATPEPVFAVYQHWQRELERQPVEFLDRRFGERMAAARSALADYLGTKRDNLVYVTNATVGVNIVARSLNLGPEDEVLSTNHEYGACDRTWRFLSHKRGYRYINQPISMPLASADDFAEQLWSGVTARTKVIYLSHITSPTAIIFPVAEVCRLAREKSILTVVDGAHVPGQINLDLEEIGADFYTGNLHKWLCAPKGVGFLYARPEVQELLEPLVISWGWESEKPGPSKFVDQHEWWGTRDIAPFLSIPAAIQFQEENNWDKVRADCHALAVEVETRICELTGLPSQYLDDSWYAQMVAVPLPFETNIVALKTRLYDDYRIEVPIIEWNGHKLIRVSVQGYNTQGDIDSLILALREFMKNILL
jgi:isopenicillin-N epimerase